MMCMLCQEVLKNRASFMSILTLSQTRDRICESCKQGFEKIGQDHCPSCYKPNVKEICQDCCYWQNKGFQVNHLSLYHYNEAMKAYFSSYKFLGDYALREVFAEELRQVLWPYQKSHQFLIVPVSPETYQERGFNQVAGLLDAAGLSYEDSFIKAPSDKQSSRSRKERLAARQVFSLKVKELTSRPILLIDDIYTTGATLQLMRQILQENGVKEIISFSLAR